MLKVKESTEEIIKMEEAGALLAWLDYGLDSEIREKDINRKLWGLLEYAYKPGMIYTIAAVLDKDSDTICYENAEEIDQIIETKIMIISGEMTFLEMHNCKPGSASAIKHRLGDIRNIKNACLSSNYNSFNEDIEKIEALADQIREIMEDYNLSNQRQILDDVESIEELTVDLLLGLDLN